MFKNCQPVRDKTLPQHFITLAMNGLIFNRLKKQATLTYLIATDITQPHGLFVLRKSWLVHPKQNKHYWPPTTNEKALEEYLINNKTSDCKTWHLYELHSLYDEAGIVITY